MILLPYLEHKPQLGPGASGHATSVVIGRGRIGAGLCLGERATLRADGHDILIGDDNWFGAASTVHIADSAFPTQTGRHVTIGRFALVHACRLGDDCLLGEGAVVMDSSHVGPGAVIAAESLVPPGKELAGGWLHAGIPAQPVREIDAAARDQWHRATRTGDLSVGKGVLWAAHPIRQALEAGAGTRAFDGCGAYIAPTASVLGCVKLAPRSSVWFGVLLDGSGGPIEVGEGSNVQDNSWLLPGRGAIRIGKLSTIGHNVRMASCDIGDHVLVGMGSVIGEGTVVKDGGCVAAGAVTDPGTVVEEGWLWSGRPARPQRELSEKNRAGFARGVQVYLGYTRNYLQTAAQSA